MRVGIIGLGRAGATHLDAWKAVANAKIAAGCDPSSSAREHGREHGLKMYTTAAAMIRCERLEAVSICAPPADHPDLTIMCLKQGVHVLCEKPLAIRTTDALEMIRVASGTKHHLLLATKFRHVPDILRARNLIAAGKIGKPVCFEIGFCSFVDMSKRWSSRLAISGGGVLIDNGCHAFDIVSFLFGSVRRVQATVLKPLQELLVEDSTTVLVEASDGIMGKIDLSWSLNTRRPHFVTVHGSRGTIDIGWSGSHLTDERGNVRKIGSGYDKDGAHQRMMNSFVRVARSQEAPWISSVESIRIVASVEAAYQSIQCGSWVSVDTKETIRREPAARQQA